MAKKEAILVVFAVGSRSAQEQKIRLSCAWKLAPTGGGEYEVDDGLFYYSKRRGGTLVYVRGIVVRWLAPYRDLAWGVRYEAKAIVFGKGRAAKKAAKRFLSAMERGER